MVKQLDQDHVINVEIYFPWIPSFFSYPCAHVLSCVWFFELPWAVVRRAPLSLGFSRQEWWSGLPCLSPANLPDTEIKPVSPALHTDPSLQRHWESPLGWPKSVFKDFHNILRKTVNELFGQSNISFTNEEAIAMKRYMTFWIAVCHLFGTAG